MRALLTLIILALLSLFTGCDQAMSSSGDAAPGAGAGMAEGGGTMSASTGGSTGASTGASSDGGAASSPSMGPESTTGGEGVGEPPPEVQAGQLTAGEWRDLDNWSFFRGLFEQGQGGQSGAFMGAESAWGLYTAGRIPVIVQAGGEPVTDALVVLTAADQTTIFKARTDNQGRAELFVGLTNNEALEGLVVSAVDGGSLLSPVSVSDVSAGGDEPIVIELDDRPIEDAADILDLMFVIDTTGSMGDELSYLQKELEDVIAQVVDHNRADLQIRLSLNFYRDNGDLYVVRSNPFTTDIDAAIAALLEESANGGGDYPEAVEEALDDAIFNHDWSPNATARMLFFVLDAPPHQNQVSVGMLGDAIMEAARLGVRVFPLAASGVDQDTETLLRLMQVATGGSYIFLTDHSGIGNSHLEPTIGDYDVELLRDLLVRVIDEHVAPGGLAPGNGQIL